MVKKLLVFIVLVFSQIATFAQLYYLNESFEEKYSRANWLSFPADPEVKWTYKKGGTTYPIAAFDGDTNAIFARGDFLYQTRTLISPPINLQGAVKPVLSFAYALPNYVFGNDELRLLFKAGTAAPWDTILVRTEAIDDWDELFFNIEEYGSKYLVDNFYLGFCGRANSGAGVCIDKVVIEEKGFIKKHIRNSSIENMNHSIIPSGVGNLPVMRVYLEVFGTVDSMKLNSIAFTSVGSNNNVFKDSGFRLYATQGSEFRIMENGKSTLITPAVSINSGVVIFTGLNFWLKTGQNYLWLTTDIKPDRFTQSNTVDFKLMPRAISINDTLLPVQETNPSGYYTIEESVFFDDFEGSSLWTINSDFEIAPPRGYIIGYTRDPGYAYSGQKCLGTDLTGNGAYLMNINSANAYYAVTPPLNLKYCIDAKLHMKTWNGFDALDNATIDVSVDNGVTWTPVWINSVDGLQAESRWNDLLFSNKFDALVRKKENVRVRFAMNYSDNQFAMSGWNIDNFAVTGNHLETDLGITRVISPYDDCFGTNNDAVRIVVRNNASVPSPASIPVFFALKGKNGIRVYDTIPGPIAPDDSVEFTFTRLAAFPAAGKYPSFTVSVDLTGDEDTSNNSYYKPIYIQQSLFPPATEKFESNEGFWRVGGSRSWECMRPDGSIPVIPESPTSWMESPYGGYPDDDTSWIYSSCYNLSQEPDLIVEMKIWMETDIGKDGMNIQYTTDNGNTWQLLGNHTSYGVNWGWFTDPVTALGSDGWSLNTNGWKKVKEFLPASLLNKTKVQFRAYWRSDGATNARGTALDDFRVFSAPPDIGVTGINAFGNSCQYHTPDKVTVTIKNQGIIAMKQNDTIIVGYDFNHVQMATDTFRLASNFLPGATLSHTFVDPVGDIGPGNYVLSAYTLIEDDPLFYGNNNDTATINFEVFPGPITSLPDTIQTRTPDTVILRPFYNPDYDYLWHDMSTEREYQVQNPGWHFVKVTDAGGNGCWVMDSTNVELLFNDVGADSMLFPVNHCGLTKNEYPKIRIRNYGTDVIAQGQKIAVMYELNGGPPKSDTLQLTKILYANHTVDFTFDRGPSDLSGAGIYNFKIYTSYGGDTIAVNDTITSSIEILGRPSVSLGPDITVQALSHTLDAGSGYVSYLWDNGATTRTREVTESGSFWVQVFDANQCDNFDTAMIRLKIRDVSPGALESPVSDCRLNSGEPVSLRILNTGTDTVPSGTAVSLSYRFQGGARVNGNMVLSQQIIPGAYVVFTFPGTISLDHTGDYSLEATAVISGDLRKDNDTSLVTIYRYAKPVVDFGLDATEFIEDVSLTIDAGYSPFYSYDWQDTTTTHLYTVTADGLYYVTATDNRTLCYDRDSVRIYLIYGDVGITWSDMPGNGCTGDFEHSRVRVTNLGPSVIGSSAPIYIACDVNGVRATVDTLLRTGNFNPGASLEMNLSGKLTISNGGDSRVTFYTLYDDDKKPVNDTLTIVFGALPAPLVDFGDVNGSLNVELPHQLDAGTGHKSYLWQDNSTAQTYMVNANGIYSVTVTGQNDCQTFKSVRINMPSGTNDISSIGKINLYPNPNNGLFKISLEGASKEVVVKIFNNQGQTVYIREFNSELFSDVPIDVQELSRGMYHMIIRDDHSTWQGKFIIQ